MVAQMERRFLKERQREGIARARSEGTYTGASAVSTERQFVTYALKVGCGPHLRSAVQESGHVLRIKGGAAGGTLMTQCQLRPAPVSCQTQRLQVTSTYLFAKMYVVHPYHQFRCDSSCAKPFKMKALTPVSFRWSVS